MERSRANNSQELQRTGRNHHTESRGQARAYSPRGDRDRDPKHTQDWSRTIAIAPARKEAVRSPTRRMPRGRNNRFIDGEGIHREVIQREICKLLGPEASFRPATVNGVTGYMLDAFKPFTPEMLENLRALSEEYIRGTREMTSRGYQGIPYRETQTSRRLSQDYLLEPPVEDPFASWPGYSMAGLECGYPSSTSHYPDAARNPSGANNYQHVPGYPPSRLTYSMPSDLPFASSDSPAGNQTTLGGSLGLLNKQNNPYSNEAGQEQQSSPSIDWHHWVPPPPKLANFYPNASQPRDLIAAHSGSMPAADNRVESFTEAPQFRSDLHNDDDESEWSGISSSDDDMVRSKTISFELLITMLFVTSQLKIISVTKADHQLQIKQPIPRHVPNRKRLLSPSPSSDERGPASKKQRRESTTSGQETVEASDDTSIPPLPRTEAPQDTNLTRQTSGDLSDKKSEDEIRKALLDLFELWTPED